MSTDGNTPTPRTRRAIVFGDNDTDRVTAVASYLPCNYSATPHPSGVMIEGYDDHGWTLDGYVLPRLRSALIWGHELIGRVMRTYEISMIADLGRADGVPLIVQIPAVSEDEAMRIFENLRNGRMSYAAALKVREVGV